MKKPRPTSNFTPVLPGPPRLFVAVAALGRGQTLSLSIVARASGPSAPGVSVRCWRTWMSYPGAGSGVASTNCKSSR